MPRNLNNLDMSEVQRNLAIHKQMLAEIDPMLEPNRGPLHDLVLYYSALFSTSNQKDIISAINSLSIGELLKSPETANPVLVDKVLSNWHIKRKEGTKAKGTIWLSPSIRIDMVLPKGYVFDHNGYEFELENTYVVKKDGKPINDFERGYTKTRGGMPAIMVPVVAKKIGSAYNLKIGTVFTAKNNGSDSLVYAHITAFENFKGGTDPETNKDLAKQILASLTAKDLSNKFSYEALIRLNFPQVTDIKIIGCNDPGMSRAWSGKWPGCMGGMVDIVIKPNDSELIKEVQEFFNTHNPYFVDILVRGVD